MLGKISDFFGKLKYSNGFSSFSLGSKKYISILILIFLFIGVFGFGYLVATGKLGTLNPNRSKASGNRGAQGDLWADVVIGQPDFNEGMPAERTADRLFNPGGVYVDKSIRPNRVYIADGGNSRILAYKSLGVCSNSPATKCTDDGDCSSGGVCNLEENKDADMVIGQADFSKGSCNGDATFSQYPNNTPPTNSTLCLMPQGQISPLEGGVFISMASDSNKNLYVPDMLNNRVLMYLDPFGQQTGGAGDRIADFVYGQADFTSRDCNRGRGLGLPSNDSLCLGQESPSAFNTGLDVDYFGNLWVTDTLNNRVLRFPYNSSLGRPSTVADLVFGQSNFTSSTSGATLNKMQKPGALSVHPTTGSILVADTYHDQPNGDGFGRVIKFTPPFTVGMDATAWGIESKPFNLPSGLEISNDGNSVWVNDTLNHMVEQWNISGTQILNILYKDSWVYGEGYQDLPCSGGGEICYQDDSRGSIGITSNGDVFLASSSNNQNVIRFKSPIRTYSQGLLTSSDYTLTRPYGLRNKLTLRSFGSPIGVEAVNNQLIVSDNWRLMFWDNASSLTNFQNASGIIGQNSGDYMDPNPYGRIRADKSNHLYVIHNQSIEIFNLPLTQLSQPIRTIGLNLKDLNNNDVQLNSFLIGGLYPADDGSYLWIANRDSNRVFRLRSPLTDNPKVDIILGQPNSSSTTCNLNGDMFSVSPNLNTLCQPGAVVMDNFGNLYVSDGSLENQGNMRLLKYNSSKLPKNNSSMLYGSSIAADKVWFYVSPTSRRNITEPAFDSNNSLVIGYNPYSYFNDKHSIEHFVNIDTDLWQNPTGVFNDYMTFPYSMDFDENQNLYVVDMNRFRVLKYLKPFGALTTPPPSTATPTVAPTSVPTPTNVPISTPSSVPTPISINGVCGALHYTCIAGSSGSPLESSSSYTWKCNGLNGGTNAQCIENKPEPTLLPCVHSTPQNYCPDRTVARDQLSVFLLRIISLLNHNPSGANYWPPTPVGQTFQDVQTNHWAYAWIEDFSKRGITGGCSVNPPQYCPSQDVTQAQMAVFFLRAEHGGSYTPPAVGLSTGFSDVPVDHWAAPWIKQMVAEGISSGCGGGKYCPEDFVPRWQMAQYLLKAEHGGASYSPPAITDGKSCFADVSPTDPHAPWIRQLSGERITGGCGPAGKGVVELLK